MTNPYETNLDKNAANYTALSPLSQDDIDTISEAGTREPFRKFWRSDFGLPPLT